MDQFNLFNTSADTPLTAAETPATIVEHTATEPAVATSRNNTPIGQNPNGIFAFALKEWRRIVKSCVHLRQRLTLACLIANYPNGQSDSPIELKITSIDVVLVLSNHLGSAII